MLSGIVQRITQAVAAGRSLDADVQSDAWDDLNAAFVEAQAPLGSWVDEALMPGRPGADDLPAALRSMWVGTDGSWLLQVFPDADPQQRSILDPQRLERFVTAMRIALGP